MLPTHVAACENLRSMEIKQREAVSNPRQRVAETCSLTAYPPSEESSQFFRRQLSRRYVCAVVICHLVFAALPECTHSGSCEPRCQRHAMHFRHQNVHATLMTTFVTYS